MTYASIDDSYPAMIESNFMLDSRWGLKGVGVNPLIVENGADSNGDICGEINATIPQIEEIGDAYILDNGGDGVFTLLIGEHCVMISGDEKCGADRRQINKEILGDQDGFWG